MKDMYKKHIVVIPLIFLSAFATAATIKTNLQMVDGQFKAQITSKDDENVWMGAVDFNYLGSLPMHCDSVSMGSSGAEGQRRTSATYECPNNLEVRITKLEAETLADFILYSDGQEQLAMKVKSSPPLKQLERSDYISKRFEENLAARNNSLKENTVPLFQACMNVIDANRVIAQAVVNNDNDYLIKVATDALRSIYGDGAVLYVERMLSYYKVNKDEAFVLSRQHSNTTYAAQICYQQPDKHIPEVEKLLLSGKIRR